MLEAFAKQNHVCPVGETREGKINGVEVGEGTRCCQSLSSWSHYRSVSAREGSAESSSGPRRPPRDQQLLLTGGAGLESGARLLPPAWELWGQDTEPGVARRGSEGGLPWPLPSARAEGFSLWFLPRKKTLLGSRE